MSVSSAPPSHEPEEGEMDATPDVIRKGRSKIVRPKPFCNADTTWVWGLEFGVEREGFGVQGSEFWVRGSGFRVQGSEFRVQDSGFGIQGVWLRLAGSEFRH